VNRTGILEPLKARTRRGSGPERVTRPRVGGVLRGRIRVGSFPPQSVYPRIDDVDGLARSCARGRELGHLGRAAVHPRQLPVILQPYLPTEEEVARARETLEAAGPAMLAGGEFVDAAMLHGAQATVALADEYGTA
jgi:citrate lyase subunit beta / citryl-CoA lyase